MSEKVRHIRRDDWTDFHEKTYARSRISFRGVETVAQLMHIGRADQPFSVPYNGKRLVIADSGYAWLQLAPKGGHWWMTAMYAPDGTPVQYYFDITACNALTDGKDAWFEDMYLDLVLHIDGTVEVLEFTVGANCEELLNIPLKELKTRKGLLLAAIVRDYQTIIPDGNTCIEEGDHVVVVTRITGLNDLTDILA